MAFQTLGTSSLALAVAQLNAPVGPVVGEDDLACALRHGSLDAVGGDPTKAALLASLFAELAPNIIAKCASEAGSDLGHANMLYEQTLKRGAPRVHAWEKAVEHLL